jgi:hypothetical protein
MTERDVPVRHAPARVDECEADERASRSTGTFGVDWVRRRVWVPFRLDRRKTALATSHPYADLPLPSPTKLAAGAPAGAGDEVIPVASQAVPHVYFPFWHLRGEGADVLVCATSGAVVRASRGNLRRAEIQRAVAVLALAFFFGGMATFIADQIVAVAVLMTLPFGQLAQLAALVAALCATGYSLAAVVRVLLRPALDESALEIVSGRSDFSSGPQVARLARWIGRVSLCVVAFEVLLAFIQTTAPVPLVLTVVVGSVLAYASLALGRTSAPGAVLDDGDRQGHSWAAAFRVYAHVLGYVVTGVFVNMLFARAGFYFAARSIFGHAIESNHAETVLVTGSVVIGVATSKLDPRQRWPVVVGLAVPAVVSPFAGPVLTIVLQLVSVTLVNRWMDENRGTRTALRRTVVRSLEVEGALVAGSLGGRLFALLLLGTSGWSVGGVIGALVMASLITAPQTQRTPAVTIST